MAQRGTSLTAFRIPPDLKAQARAVAEQRGETLTDVVIRALREYVMQPPPQLQTGPPAAAPQQAAAEPR